MSGIALLGKWIWVRVRLGLSGSKVEKSALAKALSKGSNTVLIFPKCGSMAIEEALVQNGFKGVSFRGSVSNESTIYMVVRSPRERLVSVYLEKLCDRPQEQGTIQKFGLPETFTEFVNKVTSWSFFDEHTLGFHEAMLLRFGFFPTLRVLRKSHVFLHNEIHALYRAVEADNLSVSKFRHHKVFYDDSPVKNAAEIPRNELIANKPYPPADSFYNEQLLLRLRKLEKDFDRIINRRVKSQKWRADGAI